MTNKLTLFHDASKGGKKQWSIWIEPDGVTVTVEWGLVGHTLQRSSDHAKVKGKVGTKAFKDEAACALENYERQVRKKRESGYVEADAPVVHRDVLVSLDKNFVPAKPIMDYTEDDIRRLDGQGRLVFQRKRDGRRHLALIDKTATISIYSRRMEDLTGHLAFIVDELDGMPFPPGTILDGEIIIDNEGTDDFPTVGSFTNPATKPIDAIRTARQYNVRFMLFDVLYLGGVETWKQPYSERYALLQHAVGRADGKVFVAPLLDGTFDTLKVRACEEGWEGLIAWLKDDPTIVRSGGSPKRAGCIKWKPIIEGDFIATGFDYGSGEISDVAGVLFLEEIDPGTGLRRTAGKVGTGFDADMRKEILTWSFPCVVEVRYDSQAPTGKLRFPRFMRLRDDKGVDECIGRPLETEE
jgi:bifunctional non-homologous end joining protein LigD